MEEIILAVLIGVNIIILPIICSVIAIIVYRRVGKIHKQNTEILQLLKSKE